jgi:hypothetical protein
VANPILSQYAGPDEKTHIPSYISGYFDGEGCFSVAVGPRRSLKTGWEIRPSASVSQNCDRAEVLLEVQEYFGSGTIRPDRSDRTLKWETRSHAAMRERVLPHFSRFPLRSAKQRDVELLTLVCEKMTTQDHRSVPGLIDILELISAMNPSGVRRYDLEAIISELSQVKA